MASKDRKVRENQFESIQADFATRKALLEGRGLGEKEVAKDTILKQLGAQVKKSRNRLKAMDAHAAHVVAMSEKDVKIKKGSSKGKKGKAAAQPVGKKAKGGGAKGKKK